MRRGTGLHALVWFALGVLAAAGYFIMIEEASPQKLASFVSELGGPSGTPTPVTEDAVLGRAETLNDIYWATLLAASDCTAAVRILSDFTREMGEKYGFSTDRNASGGNLRVAIRGFLDRGGDPQEAWKRLDYIDDVTKRIERACL